MVRRQRLYRDHTPVGQRKAAQACAATRRGPGFHMPAPARWRRELEFQGLRAVEVTGLAQARALFGWLHSPRRARVDGQATRRWVIRGLLAQHRQNPGEQTIAVGAQQLAGVVADRLRGPVLTRQTVHRILGEMRADGVLFQVQRGVSAQITGDRNHVSVYVVTEPDTLDADAMAQVDQLAAKLDGHLPEGIEEGLKVGGAHARKTGRISSERAGPQRRERPELFAPRTPAERAAGIDWLIADQGWQRFAERARRELQQPAGRLFAAGFSPRAVAIALGRPPDGPEHRGPLSGVRQRDRRAPLRTRNMWAVVTWRLGLWAGHQPPRDAEQPAPGRPRSAALPTPWRREPTPPSPGSAGAAALAAWREHMRARRG